MVSSFLNIFLCEWVYLGSISIISTSLKYHVVFSNQHVAQRPVLWWKMGGGNKILLILLRFLTPAKMRHCFCCLPFLDSIIITRLKSHYMKPKSVNILLLNGVCAICKVNGKKGTTQKKNKNKIVTNVILRSVIVSGNVKLSIVTLFAWLVPGHAFDGASKFLTWLNFCFNNCNNFSNSAVSFSFVYTKKSLAMLRMIRPFVRLHFYEPSGGLNEWYDQLPT